MAPLKDMLGGLHRSGTALIKRGTALGPLIPLLVIVPFLMGAAWLFRETGIVRNVPLFSSLFAVIIFVIIGSYVFNYHRFATKDPDRLQSEEFRVQMEQLEIQRVISKEGAYSPEGLDSVSNNPIIDSRTHSVDSQDNQTEEPS